MGTGTPGRGVGSAAGRASRRGRAACGLAATCALLGPLAGGPALAAQPPRALAAAPAARADPVAQLTRRIAALDARIATARSELDALTARRDQLAEELAAAQQGLVTARAALAAAKEQLAGAVAALAAAQKALPPLRKAAARATEVLDGAALAAQRAGQRAEQVQEWATAATRAEARLRAKVSKLVRADAAAAVLHGAVTDWRMAAVLQRAASARLSFARDDRGAADDALAAAKARAADAQAAAAAGAATLDHATEAHAAAVAAVPAARTQRDAARTRAAGLERDLAQARTARAAAKRLLRGLEAQRATAQEQLDRARARSTKRSSAGPVAPRALAAGWDGARWTAAASAMRAPSAAPQAWPSTSAGPAGAPRPTTPPARPVTAPARPGTSTPRPVPSTSQSPAAPSQPEAPKPPTQKPDRGERWRETGQVVRVIDGDTFDLQTTAGVQRVRINGIQAPEKQWCGGPQARRALEAVLPQGTTVWLSSRKASSGNAPYGVWRLKRTVHVEVQGQWSDIAPELLRKGLVFPFPFIGETVHNQAYLDLAVGASKQRVGLYDPQLCGPEPDEAARLRLEVVPAGPGGDEANSEFVMVFNGGTAPVDLSGWMVQDTSPLNAFFFPKGAVLAPDDFVVVYSGAGRRGIAPDGARDARFFYAGTGSRWNNDTTDIAFLFDDAGKRRTGNLRAWLILDPGR